MHWNRPQTQASVTVTSTREKASRIRTLFSFNSQYLRSQGFYFQEKSFSKNRCWIILKSGSYCYSVIYLQNKSWQERLNYIVTVWPWWRGRHPGRGRWWRIWQSVPAWRWLLSECVDEAFPLSAQSLGRRKSSRISEGHIQNTHRQTHKWLQHSYNAR